MGTNDAGDKSRDLNRFSLTLGLVRIALEVWVGVGAGRRVALPGAALEVNGLVDSLSSQAFWCHRIAFDPMDRGLPLVGFSDARRTDGSCPPPSPRPRPRSSPLVACRLGVGWWLN